MSVTAASFRATFRMFADPDLAPDDAIAYYLDQAANHLAGAIAGSRFDPRSLDRAASLYVAHYLTLDARDLQASKIPGGVPGELEGPATSKSVDKVSVSSDTKAVTWENEPFWNLTRFGIELIELVRRFGAGGIQLGTPASGDVDAFGWGWNGQG